MRIRSVLVAPALLLGQLAACQGVVGSEADGAADAPVSRALTPNYRGRKPSTGGVSDELVKGDVAPLNPFAVREQPSRTVSQGLKIGTGLRTAALPKPVPRVIDPELDMKILVLSADGTEPSVSTVVSALRQIGIPYELRIATKASSKLTESMLSSGSHGNYQGVVLATNNLVHSVGGQWISALSAEEWTALETYEAAFAVREVAAYTYPDESFGMVPNPTPAGGPFDVTLTAEGRRVFPHLQPSARIPIRGAYSYLTRAATATPLLVDGAGNALAVTHTRDNGREVMAFTFDSADFLLHGQLLGLGLANWVTRGIYLGEQHAFASAQVDDWLLPDDLYREDGELAEYRGTSLDVSTAVAWSRRVRGSAMFRDFKVGMYFNGVGSTSEFSGPDGEPDNLAPASRSAAAEFLWGSHTWSHRNLNVPGDGAGADQDDAAFKYGPARGEMTKNISAARDLGFAPFAPESLVTPQVSGLRNENVLRAMVSAGVKYVVSDASREGEDNPTPNAGIFNYGGQWTAAPNPNAKAGEVFMIPRRANNLFYNVSLPEEWVAEYNMIYRGHWGRNLSYPEIIDREADMLVSYLVRGDHAPWMFHAANLRPFALLADASGAPARSLLSDLVDAVVAKYSAYSVMPVFSPSMDDLGARVRARSLYNASGVTAVLRPAQKSISIRVAGAATVPVTGLATPTAERYGTVRIAHVALRAGESVTLTVP